MHFGRAESPCRSALYVRQERVNHIALEQSPCGCDLYVRGPGVWPIGDRDFIFVRTYLYNVYYY